MLLALPVAHLDGQGGPAVLEGSDIGEAPEDKSGCGGNEKKQDGHGGKEPAKAQPAAKSWGDAEKQIGHDGRRVLLSRLI